MWPREAESLSDSMRERLDMPLLTLKMEGAISQERKQFLEAGKGRETDSPLELPARNEGNSADTLIWDQ